MNTLGLLAAALSIPAFALTYRSSRKRLKAFRQALCGLTLLLSIPSLLFAGYYLRILPERAWFYTLRSLTGSEFLALPLGCAGGAFATLLPRVLLIVPLFAGLFLSVLPYMKQLIEPLPPDAIHEHWQGDACLQSTAAACGPACVSTILRYLGARDSESETARHSYTTATGTEAWYLARYVRSKGFNPRFEFEQEFSPQADLPAVVGVRLGSIGHFIAVLNVVENTVLFVDPISGEGRLPVSEFQRRYEFTGFRMIITRS